MGVYCSLQWSISFFAKPLLRFWGTLQGNRAILGYLGCLRAGGMTKGGVVPAPGNLARRWGGGRTNPRWLLTFAYVPLQLTHNPYHKGIPASLPKSTTWLPRNREAVFYTRFHSVRSKMLIQTFPAKEESYCQLLGVSLISNVRTGDTGPQPRMHKSEVQTGLNTKSVPITPLAAKPEWLAVRWCDVYPA